MSVNCDTIRQCLVGIKFVVMFGPCAVVTEHHPGADPHADLKSRGPLSLIERRWGRGGAGAQISHQSDDNGGGAVAVNQSLGICTCGAPSVSPQSCSRIDGGAHARGSLSDERCEGGTGHTTQEVYNTEQK